MITQSTQSVYVEVQMDWSVRRQIGRREPEQPDRRPQSAPVFRVLWMEKLLLQMDESARHLDEPLEKCVVLIALLQPEVLKNIVRLVVVLFVEALKVAEVTRVE